MLAEKSATGAADASCVNGGDHRARRLGRLPLPLSPPRLGPAPPPRCQLLWGESSSESSPRAARGAWLAPSFSPERRLPPRHKRPAQAARRDAASQRQPLAACRAIQMRRVISKKPVRVREAHPRHPAVSGGPDGAATGKTPPAAAALHPCSRPPRLIPSPCPSPRRPGSPCSVYPR